MNDLLTMLDVTLDRAVEQAEPLDHLELQNRGRRRRRIRGLSVGGAVLGLIVGVTSVALALVSGPRTPDVANEPGTPAPTSEGASTAPTEGFEDWYQRKLANLEEWIQQAPAEQQEALGDGVITADEYETARSGFAECMRQGGHDITMFPDGSYDITFGPTRPTSEEEAQLNRDESNCWDTHLGIVTAVWEWQALDHRAEWARSREQRTGRPAPAGPPEEMTEAPSS